MMRNLENSHQKEAEGKEWTGGHVLVSPWLQGHTQPCSLQGKLGSARKREHLGTCAAPVLPCAFTAENTQIKRRVK